MKGLFKRIINIMFYCILILGIYLSSIGLFQQTAMAANTGNVKNLNTTYGWVDSGYSPPPLPVGFKPAIITSSGYICIYNPLNITAKYWAYGNTTWSNIGLYQYPVPTGYVPFGSSGSFYCYKSINR